MLKQSPELFKPLEPRSVADEVTTRLREAILAGAYGPSEQLVERHIATQLGVSTIAVREAFARLVEEGLIVRLPRRGAFVAEFSAETLIDLTRVRIALEELAAELAVANWSDDADRSLRAIVQEMRGAASAGDSARLVELDAAFHEAFWHVAASETLLSLATRIRGRMVRVLREAMASLDRETLAEVWVVHEEWLDAVATRDVEKAKAAVRLHITRSCDMLVERLTELEGRAREGEVGR